MIKSDSMQIGENRITNMVLKFLDEKTKYDVEYFVNNSYTKKMISFKDKEQVEDYFDEYLKEFLTTLSEDDLLDLKSYTGYTFKNINAILRNNWNYEDNGLLTKEISNKYNNLANVISLLINKFPQLPFDMVTYRGTDITSFKSYGITNLEQLKNLSGKFMYEQGFTSTSVLRENSHFNKTIGNKNYNIEMKYLISKECNSGALLIDSLSYYDQKEYEFLIDKSNLIKIVDVKIKDDKAYLTAVLVPKTLWNNYQKEDVKKI